MKFLVIGGTGLIGSRVATRLRDLSHEVRVASPSTGVNTVTGEGLADAMAGVDVVIDVANSPSFDDDVSMDFFQSAGRNITAAEVAAGVKHHLALSVVGTERLQVMGYFRAKLAQEALIAASPIPWTLLRATQFFPFIGGIIGAGTVGDEVHLSSALVQLIGADDVADALVALALEPPVNGMVEAAGPQSEPLDAVAARYMKATGDTRRLVGSASTTYFGIPIDDQSLRPGPNARVGTETFDAWMKTAVPAF